MGQVQLLEFAVYYLTAINLVTFAAFGIDKSRAETGGYRLSEDMLVGLVVMGGLGGALAGRAIFRHKTRKRSFAEKMWGGALTNIILIGGIYYLVGASPAMMTPQEREEAEAVMASVYYPGCNEVRAAGKAPLHYGEPGYREGMDGDGDGVACEPIY